MSSSPQVTSELVVVQDPPLTINDIFASMYKQLRIHPESDSVTEDVHTLAILAEQIEATIQDQHYEDLEILVAQVNRVLEKTNDFGLNIASELLRIVAYAFERSIRLSTIQGVTATLEERHTALCEELAKVLLRKRKEETTDIPKLLGVSMVPLDKALRQAESIIHDLRKAIRGERSVDSVLMVGNTGEEMRLEINGVKVGYSRNGDQDTVCLGFEMRESDA